MISTFQAEIEHAGSKLRLPPQLGAHAERAHRKLRLAQALRVFGYLGFDHGLAGHFSARDPVNPSLFWINRLGVPFTQANLSNLVLVDKDGTIIEGGGPINESGVPYHDSIQIARQDVVGIAHAHAFWGKTWSAFRRPLSNLTADSAFFKSDQVIFIPKQEGSLSSQAKALSLAHVLGEANVLIFSNHGIWTTGKTVEIAAWRFIAFEDAARIQLVAEAANVPAPLDSSSGLPDIERREVFAHFSFLALWDRIAAANVDVTE